MSQTEVDIYRLMDDASKMEQGFRLLMQTYQRVLYFHLRSFLQVHEDIDDVLQNTFIKAYRHFGSFKRESALYSWLYRIATNEALTHIKANKKRQSTAIDEVALGSKAADGAGFSSEEIKLKLDMAIQKLPEKQREVFLMRYFREMTYEEMSSELNTSVGALKASYHFAVKKIENELKQ